MATAPLTVSLGELEALVGKAARGAGMTWGLAEEAGVAARMVAVRGGPAVELCAALLLAIDGQSDAFLPRMRNGEMAGVAGILCPVATGATVCDHAHHLAAGEALVLRSVVCPLLLLPFLCAAAAAGDGAIRATGDRADGVDVWCGPEGWTGRPPAGVEPVSLTVRHTAAVRIPARALDRAVAPEAAWRTLEHFAWRTYVPASPQSRTADAGSTLSDND